MQTQTFFFLFCVLCSFLWLKGKGRGRQVISVGKTADMIMMMLDATKGEVQKWETILFATLLPNFFSMADHFVFWRALLEKELEDVGIRLNSRPPNIYFKVFLLFSFILFFSHFFSFFSLACEDQEGWRYLVQRCRQADPFERKAGWLDSPWIQ